MDPFLASHLEIILPIVDEVGFHSGKQSFSILACIFALMSSTKLGSLHVLGVISYFLKNS